jgi:hypothetical protein
MRMQIQWEEIKKHFMGESIKETKDCNMDIMKYYDDDKLAFGHNYFICWFMDFFPQHEMSEVAK